MEKIIIGGDIVPTQSNYKLFEMSDIDGLIGKELKKLLNEANFTCFNLETPLTEYISPIAKTGPSFATPISCIKGLKAINPFFYTLANNHIMDQGSQGLKSTIKTLNENKIQFAGVGDNIDSARESHVIELKSKMKLGIYCCAEHEFSIASERYPGANPFDPLMSYDHVSKLNQQCDYIIVLYHGGKEHYRYPSPYLQKVCRKFVDSGANLVICQHSHCIGCKEKWEKGEIIYGQGNFLFDNSSSEYWKTSLLIALEIYNKRDIKIEYIPIIKKENGVRKAEGEEAKKILNDFYTRSQEIKAPDFVENNYNEYAGIMQWEYLNAFTGKWSKNILYRVINKLTKYSFARKYLGRKYKKTERIVLQNYIECEAHRELLIAGLKYKTKEKL